MARLPILATGRREIVTDEKNKPVLDERTFDKLLKAAYVLQEHNRKMRKLEEETEIQSEGLRERQQESATEAPFLARKPESEESSRSEGDYTLTLAEIVEAQRQIQVRHLELDKAMALIAEKVARIATATGAAIGILKEKMVCYRAGAGAPALPVGSEVPIAKAICVASVRTGQVIRSDDVNTEVLFDPEPCRQRGICLCSSSDLSRRRHCWSAGAIFRQNSWVRGARHPHLPTDGRPGDRSDWSRCRVEVEEIDGCRRSTMLAAIEKIQPNLAALAENDSAGCRPI